VEGPKGITVVIVDTSDDLPETTRREIMGLLDDAIATLEPLHKLDIRVLDVAGSRSRSLFSRCNPGDGAGLSEWTSNPRIARLRWLENFRKPAANAIKSSVTSAKAESSPVMGAIQDAAIDQFSSAANRNAKKSLVIISDMIEFTRDYSQYPRAGDLTYQRYKISPAYLRFRTDLKGAATSIYYVTRTTNGRAVLDRGKHMEFWKEWFQDNNGQIVHLKSLQGT